MAKKKFTSGLVYSTNKELFEDHAIKNEEIVDPSLQNLKIRLDTKQRAGKSVTIVENFEGGGIEELGRSLKNFCGTGGSVKDGLIIIQGDNREKVFQYLLKRGFKKTKKN